VNGAAQVAAVQARESKSRNRAMVDMGFLLALFNQAGSPGPVGSGATDGGLATEPKSVAGNGTERRTHIM